MIFISAVPIKRPQVLAYFLYLLIELRGEEIAQAHYNRLASPFFLLKKPTKEEEEGE